MSSNLWVILKDLEVIEERRGEDYIAKIKQTEGKELTPEEAHILGDSLLDWASHIRGKDYFDSMETVYEFGKIPYVKEKDSSDLNVDAVKEIRNMLSQGKSWDEIQTTTEKIIGNPRHASALIKSIQMSGFP